MTDRQIKLLYVGESWLGSCARTLREALARHPGVLLDEISEDLFLPRHKARWLRGVHRVFLPWYRRELADSILKRVTLLKPDVIMTYKGRHVPASLLAQIKRKSPDTLTVNVYPDVSPHAYGSAHRTAVGAYDLVISTKPFHPESWFSTYGYRNACVFVPQGYDASLHLVRAPAGAANADVALVATWRPEYHALMRDFAHALGDAEVRVIIGGNGWSCHADELPRHWQFSGELHGRAYVEFLRSASICIAPVTRTVHIDGMAQPGDEDTTRSYELAAAHCFFVHRRTPYIRTVYDENTEVPMFSDGTELAKQVLTFLKDPVERLRYSERAHARAVPAYSTDARASAIVEVLRNRVAVCDRPS